MGMWFEWNRTCNRGHGTGCDGTIALKEGNIVYIRNKGAAIQGWYHHEYLDMWYAKIERFFQHRQEYQQQQVWLVFVPVQPESAWLVRFQSCYKMPRSNWVLASHPLWMVTPCEDGALARIYRRGTLGLRPAWILEGVWCLKSLFGSWKNELRQASCHGLRHGLPFSLGWRVSWGWCSDPLSHRCTNHLWLTVNPLLWDVAPRNLPHPNHPKIAVWRNLSLEIGSISFPIPNSFPIKSESAR